jgi:hypothetical protein
VPTAVTKTSRIRSRTAARTLGILGKVVASPLALVAIALVAATLLAALWQITSGSYRLSIRWASGQVDLEPSPQGRPLR